jgi:heme-degrading monooxygenase HmoA
MIDQRLLISVVPGREAEFEDALRAAREVVFAADGFRRFTVERGVDRPSAYLVHIFWETPEEQARFSHSEGFLRWAALLDPYVVGTPVVERFEPLVELSM